MLDQGITYDEKRTRWLVQHPTASVDTSVDISHLVIEDDKPVDNFQSAQQQRFLVQTLYDSQALPVRFLAEANVGLFYQLKEDPIVPDVLLSLGIQRGDDYSQRENRSYFVWELGKLPELCIEIVSNQEGDEVDLSRKSKRKGKTVSKKDRYSEIGVQYYVVFDPLDQIQSEMGYAKAKVWTYSPDATGYSETLAQSINEVGQYIWLDRIGVGLTLWRGEFEENVTRVWLRWCDIDGNVILTGAERAKLADRRADNSDRRAEDSDRRADNAEAKAQRLADRLRELGLNPDEL